MSPHTRAVLQALFVTFLWSTSWVLIKLGLQDIPALTFAGSRYGLATLCLLPCLLRADVRRGLARLSPRGWGRLLLLGVLLFALTQGAQFVALERLPAQTTSLILSFSPVLVALASGALLGERLTAWQWLGVGGFVAGAGLFLYPADFAPGQVVGLGVAGLAVLANAGAALLGRSVNRQSELHPVAVTVVSMGVGSSLLMAVGGMTQGVPVLSAQGWLIVLWLAVVNTALAFSLWNLTLRRLSALESSVINNTMLVQIALLAWLFLGEELGSRQLAGLGLASAAALVVQLCGRRG